MEETKSEVSGGSASLLDLEDDADLQPFTEDEENKPPNFIPETPALSKVVVSVSGFNAIFFSNVDFRLFSSFFKNMK